MAERTYTLTQITHAAAPAYAEALRQQTPERAIRVFTVLLVEALKVLPEDPKPGAAMSDAIERELLSPND